MAIILSLLPNFGTWLLRSQIGRYVLIAIAVLTWIVIRDRRKMREAYKDALNDIDELDEKHAENLRKDALASDRDFFDGVRPYRDNGYRD